MRDLRPREIGHDRIYFTGNTMHKLFTSILAGCMILFVLDFGCTHSTYPREPTDEDLKSMDPAKVVNLYWESSLNGKIETIERLIGQPGSSMVWDCPPSKGPSAQKLGMKPESNNVQTQAPDFDKPIDNRDSILRHAEVLRIANRPLWRDYNLAENKSNGSEARLVYRPKDSPNPYNSAVFFLTRNGRWRIVSISDEDSLKFVGNKKFGEVRDCPGDQ
jgi:hypothetical protein